MKNYLLYTIATVSFAFKGIAQIQLQDINTGDGVAFPQYLYEYNGDLYFSATNDNIDNEIYKHDGTSVTLIPNVNTDQSLFSSNFIEFNGKLIFTYMSGQTIEGFWEYDGINTRTLIADINPKGVDGWNVPLVVYNN